MSDTSLPVIIRFDTTANRMAFTPTPGVTEQLYIWLDSDDQPNAYYWDGAAWQALNAGAGTGITDLTGDVTATGPGSVAATIANAVVTFAKMQNIATDSLIGRDTAGTGVPESITLNATLSFDGSGHIQRAALTGDVTAAAGSNATTIANSAVTLAKIANAAANDKLLGSGAAGSGAPYTEITLGTNLSMSGTTLNAAGGGGSGTVTNTGTLTLNKAIIGNGGVDVTVSAATGVAHLASGVLTGSNVDLTSEVTGDLPFANLAQIAGLSVLGVTGSATADVAAITAGTDEHVLTRVSSSSLAFALPGWVKIAENTPTGTNFSFSSLGSFTHLMIAYSARSDQSATSTAMQLTYNGDTGANYDAQRTTFGSATSFATQTAANFIQIANITAATGVANYASGGTIYIYDYRGTAFYKALELISAAEIIALSAGNIVTRNCSGWWRNTAAITSITITLASGNFVSGSKFTLYGMK